MPRRRTAALNPQSGEPMDDQEVPTAATKPEGISDEAWAIAGILGNLALATALLDVTSGKRAPSDERETTALMDAARKLEARSYKRYRALRDGLGKKLSDAQMDNYDHVVMVQILRDIEQYGPDHLTTQNGHSPLFTAIADENARRHADEPRDQIGDEAVERIASGAD